MDSWLTQGLNLCRRFGLHGRSGVLWMLITAFFFVCVHATGKHLLTEYSVTQVVWGRYAFHLLLAILVLAPRLGGLLRSANPRLQVLRSTFMLGATTFYFTGVQYLPLTEANAINFVTPIIVVILAQPLLGEQIGLWRWAGVGIGFIGAMIIIRPGSGLMDLAAGFLILSAFCNACYQLTTSKLGAVDNPLTTLLFTALVGTIGASLAVPFDWQPMDTSGWVLMFVIGAFALIGHFTLIKAFTLSPASTISPLGYSTLIWSTLFGFLIFDQWPDRWAVIGAIVIVAGGITILKAGPRHD